MSISSKVTNLVVVLEWFDACQSDAVPSSVWLSAKIALAEAFTNAVRHAHHHLPPTTPVQIDLQISASILEFVVVDFGEPFDLRGHLARLPETTDLYATSGRGLRLLESIADYLDYPHLSDGRNCLKFAKRYGPEAGAARALGKEAMQLLAEWPGTYDRDEQY